MRNLCCFVLLLFCAARGYAQSNPYLFGWVGDDAKKSDVLGDKKSEFEPYKTGEEKLTAGRLDDMRVRLFGEAAVVTGRSMFKGGFQGKPFDIRCRFTDIWVRRNGRWQIVSSQNTAIPEARATEFPPDSFFIAMEKEDWEALKH